MVRHQRATSDEFNKTFACRVSGLNSMEEVEETTDAAQPFRYLASTPLSPLNGGEYGQVIHEVDVRTQMDLVQWAARQRQVQSRMVNEERKRTPADRFQSVLSMLQASALFPDYEQAWQADESAVRQNWVRLKRKTLARAR